ncbi:acylphosphatase [Evansella sp. LMS18]|uniref:acylphosphatase n=1 Tax=Evansella sp. LMS18 TaxID=2924033 RepID=UPI0020D10679|nr:acylphosphatase [Evansella sp. LMS18]UTR11804.1 acylphosphatase [Evansella sp. LMS18]
MEKTSNWLPHLQKDVLKGVRGYKLCAYLVALEGWRRGLTLNWYSNASNASDIKKLGNSYTGKFFSLSSQERTHYFFRSRGDLVTNEAVDITRNKEETKHYFKKHNLPFPEGKRFQASSENEELISYADTIGFPLVIKPTSGSLGQGVITNIKNLESLKSAINYVRTELKFKDVIVERFISGDDYRVYVIGDQVAGAVKRKAANVVGDGKSTIRELISIKNQKRKKNPYLYTRLIKEDKEIDLFLKELKYTLDTVPVKDEVVYLKSKSNLSSGGDSVDATDELTDEMKKIAIESVKAIPGLLHAGIDIISDKKATVIIEINPTAIIGSHLFPMEGKSRDIPEAIIDYYFPETIDSKNNKSSMYFNFKSILEPLESGVTNNIEVEPAIRSTLYSKKYIISGNVQGLGFRQYLRKKAFELQLSGWVKNSDNGNIEVVAAGKGLESLESFKTICFQGTEKTQVDNVIEKNWSKPIKAGFEIIEIKEETKNKKIDKLEKELEAIKLELEDVNKLTASTKQQLWEVTQINEKLQNEKDLKEKQFRQIKNSRTWRYTEPLRRVISYLKLK